MKRRDDGAATVWVLSMAAVLAAAGIVVTLLLGVVVAHRRGSAAADLAALAAAARLQQTTTGVCSVAATVAEQNRARLRSCRLDGTSVVVSVLVPGVLPLTPDVAATARAGVPNPPFALVP